MFLDLKAIPPPPPAVLPAVKSSTVKPSVKNLAAVSRATVLVVVIFKLETGLVVPIPTLPSK